MSTVLVTGSAGFIGRHTVDELRARSHYVIGYDAAEIGRDVDGRGDRADEPGQSGRPDVVIGADIRSRADLLDALVGVDVVVHLAAKVGLGVALTDIDDYVSHNDLGTAVLLRALCESDCRRLVVASSMVVYGEGRYTCPDHGEVSPGPRTETDLAAGVFDPRCPRCGHLLKPGLVTEQAAFDPRNAYASSKVATEHLCRSWVRELDARAVALRFHNVYGPGMPSDTPYAGVASLFAAALRRGESPQVFEDGGQRRDFVHVTDVARAVAASAEAARPDGPLDAGRVHAYNVGSGEPHTVGDLANVLASALGGSRPTITGRYRLGDVRHITASSELIADQLGWRSSISFDDGVAAFADERSAGTRRPA